ncbi:MAG: hypothetical protein ACLQU2_36125 [Candidatus Binataceae bacterium]
MRAKEVIIPGQENPAELEAILGELREDWEPQGHTELHLVEQIGLAEWRLRRVHRAELGKIRSQMSMFTRMSRFKGTGVEAGKSPAWIGRLRGAIEKALAELENQGTVSKDSCDFLELFYGKEKDSPAAMLKVWFLGEKPKGNKDDLVSDGEPTSTADEGQPDKQDAACELLEMMLENLARHERELRKQERTDLEIARQSLSIPHGRGLECIQRYETTIKRDMYRAMDQLEHLQRRRRGEPPPPTVNVNVSRDDDD